MKYWVGSDDSARQDFDTVQMTDLHNTARVAETELTFSETEIGHRFPRGAVVEERLVFIGKFLCVSSKAFI